MSANQGNFWGPAGGGVDEPTSPGGQLIELTDETTGVLPSSRHSQDILHQMSTGRITFAGLSRAGGLDVSVGAGTGIVKEGPPSDPSPASLTSVSWSSITITLSDESCSFIFVDKAGTVQSSTTEPDSEKNIVLGMAITDAGVVAFLSLVDVDLIQKVADRFKYLKDAVGARVVSGLTITEHSAPSLQIAGDSGTFYVAEDRKEIASATAPITFTYWLKDGVGGFKTVASQTTIDANNYDDGSGTPAAIPAGKYKKDLVFGAPITNTTLEYHVIYGQELFDDQGAAEAGFLPTPPGCFINFGVRLAGIVTSDTSTQIEAISDERPIDDQIATGSTSVFDHGLLSGLGDNDHPQYQTRSEEDQANGYPGLDASTEIIRAQLKDFIGDSGSGGVKGAVPAPAIGDAAKFLRGDGTWDNLDSQIASAITTTQTTSTTFVLMPGMTITPPVGTYAVIFTAEVTNLNNQNVFVAIRSGGSVITNSERQVSSSSNVANQEVSTIAQVTVNGSQSIEAVWKVNTATGEARGRSLLIIRVA